MAVKPTDQQLMDQAYAIVRKIGEPKIHETFIFNVLKLERRVGELEEKLDQLDQLPKPRVAKRKAK